MSVLGQKLIDPEHIQVLSTWHQWVDSGEIHTMQQNRKLLQTVALSYPSPS